MALERQIALNTPHLAVTQVFYNTCVTVSKREKWQSISLNLVEAHHPAKSATNSSLILCFPSSRT